MRFLVTLTLLSFVLSAPFYSKSFHDHVEDFLEMIVEEVGDRLNVLLAQYLERENFVATLEYLRTAEFSNVVYDIESLPAFINMTNYLERNRIDVNYFITRFNSILERLTDSDVMDYLDKVTEGVQNIYTTRKQISGKDFRSFITNCIEIFPREMLADLYDQKLDEEEDFKAAMESLGTEEWISLSERLWSNETFLADIKVLDTKGVDIEFVVDQLWTMFGEE